MQEEFKFEALARKALWDEKLSIINNVTLPVFSIKELRQEIGQQASLLAERHTIMAIGNTLQKLQTFKDFSFPSNAVIIKEHLAMIKDIKGMMQDIVARQTINAVGNVLMQEQARTESLARKALWDEKLAIINSVTLPIFNFKELRQEIGQQASLLAERHTIMAIGHTLQKLQTFKEFSFPSNKAIIKENFGILKDIKGMIQDIVARQTINAVGHVLMQEQARIESLAHKALWDEKLAIINNVTLPVFSIKKLRQEIGQQARLVVERHTMMAIGSALHKLQAFKGFSFPSNDEVIKEHLSIIKDIKSMTQDIVTRQTINAVGNVLMQEQVKILESKKMLEKPIPEKIEPTVQIIMPTEKIIESVAQRIKPINILTTMQEMNIVDLKSSAFEYFLSEIRQELIRVTQSKSKAIVNIENHANTIQKQEHAANKLANNNEHSDDCSESMLQT